MHVENIRFTARSNPSQRIIAIGIVFAFLYWASSIVMTLLLAVLLAYFLDPVVEALGRVHIPRALGALLVLLMVTSVVGGLGYLVLDRTSEFITAWPKYSQVLRHAATAFEQKLATVERQVASITPEEERGRPAVRVTESNPVRALLFRGLGSLYSILLVGTFLPFLVFFMLAGKRRIWQATMGLFEEHDRDRVKIALEHLNSMLRSYVAGNAVVALILMLASWAFFWMIHLDYAFLTGCASGLLNLVPYLGAVLAWIPPYLIGMAQWNTIGPFLGIAGVLVFFHIIAINVLMPSIVGRRVHLNALAVTISLLFWGWLWGAVGLLLAIPITATVKVICDHVDQWEAFGRWLGA